LNNLDVGKMIYPCIDLMNGKIVQLVQGRRENKEIEISDYNEIINRFKPFKTIQLIDLDAAMGKCNNYELIKKILNEIKCRVGGGIRTIEKAEEIIKLGAEKVIVGSSIFIKDKNGFKINYDFLKELNNKINKEKIILAIDSLKEEIVIKGWKEKTGINVFDAVKELGPYCSEFLATYVDKEGMLKGTDLGFFKRLRKLTMNKITAAGGITTIDEVKELEKNNISSALGMAIYSGKLKLDDLKELV